jgi:2-oxo-3-hexenedioate decarboxylase
VLGSWQLDVWELGVDVSVSTVDVHSLAQELMDAYASGQILSVPPSSRDPDFDLAAAYAVEAELARRRRASGRRTVGRKVGFANKALWRVLKLDTLVWAHMYDETVRYAHANTASLPVAHMCSPKIEPEIVFKMKTPVGSSDLEPTAVLDAVEWLALGFEIIDCVFADWKFQPSDFVAAFGLHAALVVGEPRSLEPGTIPSIVDQLPRFKVRLLKNGQLIDEGSGKNSLRSPALCLAELVSAIARQPGAEPLAAGELVSSGTLTESQPIAPGETWTAIVEGLDLPALTLRTDS